MSEFTRTRHLFLPCVQFELSVYPTGDSAPTPIERAAMLLIGSFWDAREKFAIDVFLDIMSLGEPGGRELINGLWRKGWIVIGGADATLYPSAAIQAHLRVKGANADFADMGTGEGPEKFELFYDLILGQPFLAPDSKISHSGDRPYMIEPFYPESNDAPYGLWMSSFIDLTKPELIATLQHDGRFRKWRTPLEAMEFKVVPPAQNLSQKDIQYVRIFFDIGRDTRTGEEDGSYRDFIMRGAEHRSNETLKRLADSLSGPIVDKVLSQDTPLREKFLDEVPSSRLRRRSHKHRASSRIAVARERFDDIEDAAERDVKGIFAEARELTERAVREIRDALTRSKLRQAEVLFIPKRSQVEDLCIEMLNRFTDQAVLISQDATAGKIVQAIEAAEKSTSASKRLLIQTGGVNSTTKTAALKRSVRRVRDLDTSRIQKKHARTSVHTQYVDRFDLFVDASLLIRDGAEILFAASSLLVAGNSPQTAFYIDLLDQHPSSRRSRYSSGNAAKEMLSHIAPTFVSPSPMLEVRASRQQAPEHPASDLETHLETLLSQLGDEANVLARDGIGPHEDAGDARKLAGMIAAELEKIDRLLELYEKEAPLTVEGLQDDEILAEAANMIARAPADKPIIIGLHPTEHIDSLFKESLAEALEVERAVTLRLIFLSQPNDAWLQYRQHLLSSRRGAIEIDDPVTLTNEVLQHRQGFSNFLICGLGCLVASGGFTRRILLGPKRRDKKQLGIIFRGSGSQKAATDMLRSLLPATDMSGVPAAEVYSSTSDPGEVDSFLASHMFHRWLVDIATYKMVDQEPERINNIGTSALLPAFRSEQSMYERCVKSAIDLGKEDYLHAVRKAGHLAGMLDRDSFAEALWEEGRLFEAVLICVNPRPGHPLADQDLRDYVAAVYQDERPDRAVSVRPSWLHGEDILALLALDLLDPERRIALRALDAQSFPQTPLGRLAKAIWSHADTAPAAPIVLVPSGRDGPPHPPQVYCAQLGEKLKQLEQDRANKESNSVQALLRQRYVPIADLWLWWHGQQERTFQSHEDAAEAVVVVRDALTKEFNTEFEKRLSSRGNREKVAMEAVIEYDAVNRMENPIHRALVGPKKQGLVNYVAGTLEVMISLHLAAKSASDVTGTQERRVVQKCARAWLDSGADSPHNSPRAVLSRILRSEGRLAPEGHVDFDLWRFPRYLEMNSRGAKREELGASLLEEEWPSDIDESVVLEKMLTAGRFIAADTILKTCKAKLPVGESKEAFGKLLALEDRLQQRTELAAKEILIAARGLELEAARAGDRHACVAAGNLRELHDGLSLTPQEVEDGEDELRKIRIGLDKCTDAEWTSIVAALLHEGDIWRKCAAAIAGLPISRRRSVMQAVMRDRGFTLPGFTPPGRTHVTRSRLRSLTEDPNATLDKAAKILQIPAEGVRGKAVLRAAPGLFEEQKFATAEAIANFVSALNALFLSEADTSGPVTLDQTTDASLWSEVYLPPDGLRAWLDWQFPKHRVVVLLTENAGDVKLDDLGIPDDRLPVIINPFLSTPLLSEPHVLLDFADVVAATALPDPADAIKASVAGKVGWDLVLPWDKQDETAQDAELARFLSCDVQELVNPPGSEAAARMLCRLLTRLRVVPRWKQRNLFTEPADAALTANLCLSYCSSGHVAEAFAAILHARSKFQELRGTVHVDDFLEGNGMNDRIVDQALSMMRRWHRMRRLDLPNLQKRAMRTLLCTLWLHSPEGHDREAVDMLAAQAVHSDDAGGAWHELGKSLADWLLAEGILIAAGSGNGIRFFPNPAHILTTVEY